MRTDFITTNSLLKIVSLALAVILWFFVVSSKRSETTLDVPVRFKNLPPSIEIVNGQKTVSVRIEGQKRLLRGLRQDDVSVVIDLNGYKEGMVSYHLSSKNIRIPDSFVIKNIYPSKINFTLRKIEK